MTSPKKAHLLRGGIGYPAPAKAKAAKPQAKPQAQTVKVGRGSYLWTPGVGLDTAAVLELAGFIRRMALRYRYPALVLTNGGLDDLDQAGYLGALKVAKTFDPSHGASFLTYAAYAINKAICELATGKTNGRQENKQPDAALDALIEAGAWDPGIEATAEIEAYEAERTALLWRILAEIPQRRALFLRLFYSMEARADKGNRGKKGTGHSRFKAIAALMDTTANAVMNQCHKGLANAKTVAAALLGAA